MYAIVWLHRSRMNNREIYVLNRDPFSSKCSLLCLLQMIFIQEISNVFRQREASTGGHCLNYYPGALALWSSHCKSFDRRVPADIIPRYPIFKWVTVTSWWRHQMETFSALLAICAGNSPVIGEFPAQRPVTRSFDVFFDLRLNNGWVNNREARDLRRYRAHYDVTVMWSERKGTWMVVLAIATRWIIPYKAHLFRSKLFTPISTTVQHDFKYLSGSSTRRYAMHWAFCILQCACVCVWVLN